MHFSTFCLSRKYHDNTGNTGNIAEKYLVNIGPAIPLVGVSWWDPTPILRLTVSRVKYEFNVWLKIPFHQIHCRKPFTTAHFQKSKKGVKITNIHDLKYIDKFIYMTLWWNSSFPQFHQCYQDIFCQNKRLHE